MNNSQPSSFKAPLIPPGYKQTEVGVIPEDWEVKRIGSVCKLINGRGFKPYEWQTTGLPIIRIQNLNGSDEFNYFSGLYDKKLDVGPGQLLFAWSGSRGTSFGPHVWRGPFGLLNYHTWKVQVLESVVAKDFLFHELRQLTAYIEGWAHGAAALVHVQKWQMEGFEIPLPPTKAEQEAIAEALRDADALIESLEQLVAKKRQVKQGAMQELLTGKKRLPGFEVKPGYKQTEVGMIPEDWEVVSAFEACSKIQDGTHFSPRSGGNDYLYVTSRNVRFGHLDLSTAGWIDAAQHQAIYRRCDVKKGDLLLTKDGANTGNAALNTLAEEFSLLSSVAFLRFNPSKHCAAYFLQQVLTLQGQRQIQDAMAGNAITRLTLEKINKLRFPVPPSKAEEEAIAVILSDMDAEIAALEAKLAKACDLKQGMMQELLTGRIRLI